MSGPSPRRFEFRITERDSTLRHLAGPTFDQPEAPEMVRFGLVVVVPPQPTILGVPHVFLLFLCVFVPRFLGGGFRAPAVFPPWVGLHIVQRQCKVSFFWVGVIFCFDSRDKIMSETCLCDLSLFPEPKMRLSLVQIS